MDNQLNNGACPKCGGRTFILTETLCWQGYTDENANGDKNKIDFTNCFENSIDEIVCKACGAEISLTTETEFE